MASGKHLLSARKVETLSEAGMYRDGPGFYLKVDQQGRKGWVVRKNFKGKRTDFRLGTIAQGVTLAIARERAEECLELLASGIDPREARKQQAVSPEAPPSFWECCEGWHAEKMKIHKWRNAKHAAQNINTLRDYAKPSLGEVPIDEISKSMVRNALFDVWHSKHETASRVRQRIEAVLLWAEQNELISEAPNISTRALGLEKPDRSVIHHASLPYEKVPGFLASERDELERDRFRSQTTYLLLEFTILTAARLGESRNATWDEIDWNNSLWIVPSSRMKGKREHRVPLSTRAIEILEIMKAQRRDEVGLIFPSRKAGRPLSDNVLKALYERRELRITTHGFRSSFRNWAAQQSEFAYEVAEACLAHAIGSKTERAYLRDDYLDQRRDLVLAP